VSAFVDTNVFIRLLAQDDPARTERCRELFERAERGEVSLFTSEAIIAEIVYVLSSRTLYHLPRADVAYLLRPLLENPGLQVEHEATILSALDRYVQSNLDFEDCLVVEHSLRLQLADIYTYDRGFNRVPGLRRLEP
jgi:predicted nucleic acid-binding protein